MKLLLYWAHQRDTCTIEMFVKITHGFDGKFFKALEKPTTSTTISPKKRPASTTKRPASASKTRDPRKKPAACMKKPSSAISSNNARIFVVDESHLNKHKPGKLSKQGRPQKDQVWIWGAALQGNMSTHFMFKILKHPADALDGKPRNHKEMLENLRYLGLRHQLRYLGARQGESHCVVCGDSQSRRALRAPNR